MFSSVQFMANCWHLLSVCLYTCSMQQLHAANLYTCCIPASRLVITNNLEWRNDECPHSDIAEYGQSL